MSIRQGQAFDNMPAGNKYHATFLDAEHAAFGNIPDGFYHDWIKQMTIAFFDAYLLDDSSALSWLQSRDIERLSSYVTLETK